MPPRNKKNFRATKKGAGMTKAGVKAYRRLNPGSKLKTAVTGKVKKGSKAAKRRKSFCARSLGQMKKFPKAARNPNSRLRQARRRWKCQEDKMPYGKGTYGSKVGRPKKKRGKTKKPGPAIKGRKAKVKDALYRGKPSKGPKKMQKPILRKPPKKGPKRVKPAGLTAKQKTLPPALQKKILAAKKRKKK